MKNLLKILSYIALALTIIPAFLVFKGLISDQVYKSLILAGTIGWLITAPFWIFKEKENA